MGRFVLYAKLAWRNLFRNKRRTIIAGTAIGIGLASLIFVDGVMLGMEKNMTASATSSFLGEAQIHAAGYRDARESALVIHNLNSVLTTLEHSDIVDRSTVRVFSLATISSPGNIAAVSLVGIEPSTEQYLSQIDDAMIEGAYFEGDDRHDLTIGSRLAEILEVVIGDRVVVTVAQSDGGDLSQEMFRVSGIYHFNANDMDRAMAFVRISSAQKMLAIGSDVHEIALTFVDRNLAQNDSLPFWEELSRYNNEAVSWQILLPQIQAALELVGFTMLLVGLILFGVVSLGIVNTLFMSMYERMFEFGVLRAVGTPPFAMAQQIMLEAASLAVVSVVIGSLIGWGVTYYALVTGIDYRGIEYSGITIRTLLYPVLELRQFVFYPLVTGFLTVVVGLYPAVYAARLSPAKAMRRSM
ncbi:MAG: ABC transporter permease [Candidatus Zixiibacteriota bacterium]